jgi:hypothetical protein
MVEAVSTNEGSESLVRGRDDDDEEDDNPSEMEVRREGLAAGGRQGRPRSRRAPTARVLVHLGSSRPGLGGNEPVELSMVEAVSTNEGSESLVRGRDDDDEGVQQLGAAAPSMSRRPSRDTTTRLGPAAPVLERKPLLASPCASDDDLECLRA